MPKPSSLASGQLLDAMVAVLAWVAAGLVSAGIAWVIGALIAQGLPQISWTFLTELPRDSGRQGGIRPILISTVMILAVCLAASAPIALGTAVYLAECQSTRRGLAPLVRYSLHTLAGVPSIVFGLFGNAFFSVALGLGFSILSGGLTLACMVLPVLISSMETSLHAVPTEFRLTAAALGLPRSVWLVHIVLPAAAPGFAMGAILGVGRALAETAALLYTSGYVDRVPESLLDSGRALSVHIYDLAMNVPGGAGQGSASALVLVLLMLAISGITRWLGQYWLGTLRHKGA